ncbi:hypothetical protein BMS3Abin17_00292 [archaeon BMS3Abin17]|nr:hypothetical protein BMS3Abin17_00292 [archaeon BMS3Abin17]HDZ60372.1 hypothetical protein [Candidatus Pacearchaeota archaeon]
MVICLNNVDVRIKENSFLISDVSNEVGVGCPPDFNKPVFITGNFSRPDGTTFIQGIELIEGRQREASIIYSPRLDQAYLWQIKGFGPPTYDVSKEKKSIKNLVPQLC